MIDLQDKPKMLANKIPWEDLAQTCYAVFARCNGISAPWESADQFPWVRLAMSIGSFIDDSVKNETELSISSTASMIFEKLHSPNGESDNQYDSLEENARLVYNVIARHMVNVIDANNIDGMAEKEAAAIRWFNNKRGQ